jgi:hypothetical protein
MVGILVMKFLRVEIDEKGMTLLFAQERASTFSTKVEKLVKIVRQKATESEQRRAMRLTSQPICVRFMPVFTKGA